jgi:hypothetical protein
MSAKSCASSTTIASNFLPLGSSSAIAIMDAGSCSSQYWLSPSPTGGAAPQS